MKRCRVCRQEFSARSSLHVTCSPPCAIEYAKTDRARRDRKRAVDAARREDRERVKTPRTLASEAQAAFNRFIRARDAGKPCAACGHPDDGSRQRHAGHFKPAGKNPALRFDEANVHACCSICNNWLSGNLVPYRAELIRRIGLAEVERLEGPQEPRRYRSDDYRAIKREYAEKCRELLKQREAA